MAAMDTGDGPNRGGRGSGQWQNNNRGSYNRGGRNNYDNRGYSSNNRGGYGGNTNYNRSGYNTGGYNNQYSGNQPYAGRQAWGGGSRGEQTSRLHGHIVKQSLYSRLGLSACIALSHILATKQPIVTVSTKGVSAGRGRGRGRGGRTGSQFSDPEDVKFLKTLKGHTKKVTAVAINPDDQQVSQQKQGAI